MTSFAPNPRPLDQTTAYLQKWLRGDVEAMGWPVKDWQATIKITDSYGDPEEIKLQVLPHTTAPFSLIDKLTPVGVFLGTGKGNEMHLVFAHHTPFNAGVVARFSLRNPITQQVMLFDPVDYFLHATQILEYFVQPFLRIGQAPECIPVRVPEGETSWSSLMGRVDKFLLASEHTKERLDNGTDEQIERLRLLTWRGWDKI